MGIIWPSVPDPYAPIRPPLFAQPVRARRILKELRDLQVLYSQCFRKPPLFTTRTTFELLQPFRDLLSDLEERVDPQVQLLLEREEITNECKEDILAEVQAFRFTVQYNEERFRKSLDPLEVERFDLENPAQILGL
jgi:hypothetical protein